MTAALTYLGAALALAWFEFLGSRALAAPLFSINDYITDILEFQTFLTRTICLTIAWAACVIVLHVVGLRDEVLDRHGVGQSERKLRWWITILFGGLVLLCAVRTIIFTAVTIMDCLRQHTWRLLPRDWLGPIYLLFTITFAVSCRTLTAALREYVMNRYVKRLGRCERCGYDLRGNPTAGRCPECGAEQIPYRDHGQHNPSS